VKRPEQLLATLTGNANGLWKLKIGDDEGPIGGTNTDNGRLLSWYIKLKNCLSDTVVIWSTNVAANSANSLNALANQSNTSQYYVIIGNGIGCFESDTISVSTHGSQVSIAGNTYLCSNTNTSLSVNPNFISYLWSNGANTNSIIADTANTYSIQVTDSVGCTSSDTVIVTQLNSSIAVSEMNDTLFALPENASYQWLYCDSSTMYLTDTNQTFAPIYEGGYAVIINQFGCIDTSACYPFVFMGIAEPIDSERIGLYPNPVTNQLSIYNTPSIIYNLTIQNTLGQTIYSKQNCNALETIDVSGFAKGIYFVRVNREVRKLFKQ
jgi:hypothetical protein